MVWFTFNFLLGIPGDSNPTSPRGVSKSKAGNKLNFKHKYAEIEVDKPNFFFHIEYVLFPGHSPKSIDVICWNEVAKIYFENSICAIELYALENLNWIYFRVNHNLDLTNDEVLVMRSHVLKITVSSGNKKFGNQAKSDNSKKFYTLLFTDDDDENSNESNYYDDDDDNNNEDYKYEENGETEGNFAFKKQIFQPVSDTLENLPYISFYKEHLTYLQQLYVALDTTVETNEYHERLINVMTKLTKEYNDENFKKIKTMCPKEIPSIKTLSGSRVEPSTTARLDKKEKTTDKKKESGKDVGGNSGDSIEILIPGENVFSGNDIIENTIKYNLKEMPFFYNLIRIRNPLSEYQRRHFNPMSVTLGHCNFLPINDFKKSGITHVKFRYLVFDEYLIESNPLPIDSKIHIDYTRTLFTNKDNIDETRFIYFLQTGGLKIHLLGNFKPEKSIKSKSLYDENKIFKKKNIYKRNNYYYHDEDDFESGEFSIIGTGFVDLSSLMNQPHRIFFKCNLLIPPPSPNDSSTCATKNFKNFTTIYEFYSYKRKKLQLELSKMSVPSTPTLAVSVRIGYTPLKVYQTVVMNPNLLNKLFAVICDADIVESVVKSIENDTCENLDSVDYFKNNICVKRPLTVNHKGDVISLENLKKDQLTGFLISVGDKTLVYVEGPMYGAIKQIWAIVSCMKPHQGHVLYDSSLIFTQRIYDSFFKHGGFLKIYLNNKFDTDYPSLIGYGPCCMPEITWKALISINMLMHCKSIQLAIHNNLFPEPESLFSLALQIGNPPQLQKFCKIKHL